MYLTNAQREAVRSELDQALAALRAAEEAVVDARDQTGNQAENSTLDTALDEQRRLAERATSLSEILAAAEDAPAPRGDVAEPGTRVSVQFGTGPQESYLFGTTTGAEEDVITPASPLGQALLGRAAGETVEFAAPNGRVVQLSLCSVEVA